MAMHVKGDRVFLPARFGMLAGHIGEVADVDDQGWAIVDLGNYGEIGCPVEDLIAEADKQTTAGAGATPQQ